MWMANSTMSSSPHTRRSATRTPPSKPKTGDRPCLACRPECVRANADHPVRRHRLWHASVHPRLRTDDHARIDEFHQSCPWRSEEHTSELQSLMRISYAVFCLKKKKKQKTDINTLKYRNVRNNANNTNKYISHKVKPRTSNSVRELATHKHDNTNRYHDLVL